MKCLTKRKQESERHTDKANSISKYYNVGGYRLLSGSTIFFLPEVHGALFTTCNFTLIDSRCFTVLLLVLHQKFIVSIGSPGTIAHVRLLNRAETWGFTKTTNIRIRAG